ncbi:MAG: GTP-binding protein, partial [Rubrivivax sp.]|nr:GTP-binding protein [Rubrivivax sp.]
MTHESDLIARDIDAYLHRHESKSLLRFITCGSVDDGKSTLIGRLLYDSKMLFEDQLAAVERDSRRWGTQGDAIDFALLVDGLAAEREQGITIDVAYRYFSTERRKFIVADTPGHEQYTRNMVTGASTADVAVILVDARKGLLAQTRRHSFLVHLLGIRTVVLAVNKMDQVDYAEDVFARIDTDYRSFAAPLGFAQVTSIPLSALAGDNITTQSAAMPWYPGPALLPLLESCELDQTRLQRQPLRLPIQWVNRPHAEFRGFCGQLASGVLEVGQRVRVQPSGRLTQVARIVAPEGDRRQVLAGESVTITLADEIDLSRGDIVSAADSPAEVADQFECSLVWMADEPMLPGRPYLLKIGTRTVGATITEAKYKINVNTLEHLAARQLELNEI